MSRHHEDWLRFDELKALTGWSERTIHRKKSSGELRSRAGEKSGNGKPAVEYAAASLPAEFLLKRMSAKMASAALVPVKYSDTAVPSLPEPASPKVVMALDALDAEARRQAEHRLKIIAPLIDFRNRTNGHNPLFRGTDGAEFATLNAVIQHLVKVTKYSERTIRGWWKRYKEDGPGALADRVRSDAGKSRSFAAHPEAASFCRNKYLNERLSIALVHKALKREWERLRSDHCEPPTYESLRVYLQREIKPLVKMIARDGDRVYKEDAAPYIIRDISRIRCNQVWISDHMIHDVWCRNDGVFGELAENEALRPWLTCITDMRSRRVIAPAWCATPSSRSIGDALLLGMRLFGKPREFYVDNGKDYNKLSDEQQGVLIRLGIESRPCLPLHPQSKQIESFFGNSVHQQFDKLWRPFYAGSSPATRPEECDEALRLHKRLLKEGRGNESPLPAAREFIRAAARYLDEFNETPHTGQGMSRRTPNDVFDAELPPERRSPVNPADVAQLFWERDTRKVCEGGCVRLDRWRFEPADQESFAQLMLIVGTDVIVARSPRNLSEAIALTNEREPKYLGHLRSQEMAVHGETDREVIRLRMRKEGRVRTAVKQLTAALARQRALAGDLTEREALQRRASASAVQPLIHALPVLKAVGAEMQQPRLHADDIADSYSEEN